MYSRTSVDAAQLMDIHGHPAGNTGAFKCLRHYSSLMANLRTQESKQVLALHGCISGRCGLGITPILSIL